MKSLGILIGLLFILTACSTLTTPELVFDYVATVQISKTTTQADLESQYSARIISFQPEIGFAILALDEKQAQAANLNVEENIDALGASEVTADGFSVWAGGFSVWAGGWSVWAGGWNAWAGGNSNIPRMPNTNRYNLMHFALPQAHALSHNFGKDVVVAVIDSGLSLDHPMFQGRVSEHRYDFVDGDADPSEEGNANDKGYGHGTAVAGAVLQVAPLAKIMPLRVLDSSGKGNLSAVVSAIQYAVDRGAHVINLSLGSETNHESLEAIINYASSKGVYIIASAGNSGDAMTYPAAKASTLANEEYVISVGSSGYWGHLSDFSARQGDLEVTAPGQEVYTAFPGGLTGHASGTSFAAPLVSGLLALAMAEIGLDKLEKVNLQKLLASGSATNGTETIRNSIVANRVVKQLPGFESRKALFVVGDDQTLYKADDDVTNRLQSLGYKTTLLDDAAVTALDAKGMDVVLISATVDATLLKDTFREVAVPIVTWNASLFDDLGMVDEVLTSTIDSEVAREIKIIDSNHPISVGFQDVIGKFISGKQPKQVKYGYPYGEATLAISNTETPYPILFAYEQDAQMFGLKAPARRVGMAIPDVGSDVISYPGRFIFSAALTWATTGN